MKILLADDHWIVRSAMRQLLSRLEPACEVIEATDFHQVLRLVDEHPDVDLALLDLVMPGMNRLKGLIELRHDKPAMPLVVISALEDRRIIRRCMSAGVTGYIPKSAPSQEVESMLQTVLDGGVAFPPRLLAPGHPADQALIGGMAPARPLGEALRGLTPRQRQVFKCLGQGMTNLEISRSLGISPHTVRAHSAAIVQRLGVGNRTQVALNAAMLLAETETL